MLSGIHVHDRDLGNVHSQCTSFKLTLAKSGACNICNGFKND